MRLVVAYYVYKVVQKVSHRFGKLIVSSNRITNAIIRFSKH